MRASLAAALVSFSLFASPVLAQQSTTRGWSLGAALQGTSLSVQDGEASSGGGLGLHAGYGFNRRVTGFVHVDGASIDVPVGAAVSGTWSLAHAELGARFFFSNSLRRARPFLETSIGARAVTVEDAQSGNTTASKVKFNGGAFTLGGGVATYLKPSLSLDVGLKFTGGKFTEVDFGSVAVRNLDVDASSFRFGVGLTWWP